MANRKTNAASFKRGRKKTGGRKPGVANKFNRDLKEAILAAGERVGYDGKGLRGLPGYLERLAEKYPQYYSPLLGRTLPMKITTTISVTIRSKEDIVRELKNLRIPVTHIFDQAPIPVLELETKVRDTNNAQEY
jgi:hypothetical protein